MQREEWDDSEPSVVQAGSGDLPGWAARIGWSRRQLQDAIESGLVTKGTALESARPDKSHDPGEKKRRH